MEPRPNVRVFRFIDTVSMFKASVAKFGYHKDVKFYFMFDLTGIGDRSVMK